MACGAQTKSAEDDFPTESNPSNTTASMLSLPQTFTIDFPLVLSRLNNNLFLQNIQSIQNIISIQKDNLKLLEQVMGAITQECQAKTACHIEANHFRVEENNQSVFLGEINFREDASAKKYRYTLALKVSSDKKLIFKWSDMSREVVSIYQEPNHQVKMHYFGDTLEQKEALFIEDNKSTSQNSLMISLDSNSKTYKLQSNYISKDESFSSNILVKNKVLLEENENIYALSSDFSNFKEGTYLLFSSIENLENLNLVELFEKALGSFLRFENRLEGFTYKSLEDEAVIPYRITALD